MLGWFKSAPVQEETLKAPMLHGVNLDKWHYLGTVVLTFKDSTSKCTVFMFANKKDLTRRRYEIPLDVGEFKKYHTYLPNCLDPWCVGERKIYTFVKDPSRWLSEYMFEKHNSVWDANTKWWGTPDSVKYSATVLKQKKKTVDENGVIQVDFGGNNK